MSQQQPGIIAQRNHAPLLDHPSGSDEGESRLQREDLRLSSTAKVFACRFCPRNFKTQGPKYRHERLKHLLEGPISCRYCSLIATTVFALIPHEDKHDANDKLLRCQHCDYTSNNTGDITKHIRVHTGERPFKCRFCPYRAKVTCDVRKHERRHKVGEGQATAAVLLIPPSPTSRLYYRAPKSITPDVPVSSTSPTADTARAALLNGEKKRKRQRKPVPATTDTAQAALLHGEKKRKRQRKPVPATADGSGLLSSFGGADDVSEAAAVSLLLQLHPEKWRRMEVA